MRCWFVKSFFKPLHQVIEHMCPHMDVCYIFLNNTIIFFSTKLKQSFWGSVKRINHTGSDIICQIFAFKMLKNWQTGTRNPHKLVKVKKIACRLVCTSLPVTMTLVLKNCKLWTFMWNKFELSIWFRIGIKKKNYFYTHKMFKKKLCTYSFTSTKMSSWATYDHTSTLACCNFILLTRTVFVCFMTSKNLHIKKYPVYTITAFAENGDFFTKNIRYFLYLQIVTEVRGWHTHRLLVHLVCFLWRVRAITTTWSW